MKLIANFALQSMFAYERHVILVFQSYIFLFLLWSCRYRRYSGIFMKEMSKLWTLNSKCWNKELKIVLNLQIATYEHFCVCGISPYLNQWKHFNQNKNSFHFYNHYKRCMDCVYMVVINFNTRKLCANIENLINHFTNEHFPSFPFYDLWIMHQKIISF